MITLKSLKQEIEQIKKEIWNEKKFITKDFNTCTEWKEIEFLKKQGWISDGTWKGYSGSIYETLKIEVKD